jgi:hypothetical protein
MNILDQLLPTKDGPREWVAIFTTVFLAALLTILGIHGIGEYGIALFILTPIFIGFCPTILYGYHKEITKKKSFQLGITTLVLYTIALIIFALEGLICIAMAAPFGVVLTLVGSMIGYGITDKTPKNGPAAMFILLLAIPSTAIIEHANSDEDLIKVTTSVVVDADIETVWKNVVEFPELEAPQEFLFKAGVAYPINAKIEGQGVGAIRHCNFSTGSFVEPITVWNKPTLLKFDVVQNPPPMKELSFWDINAPHLHDYFVSKKGQFKLTALSNGKTRLEGTTWYYHNISPIFYWRLWSDHIIHKIHRRVLNHIKKVSEKEPSTL